MVRLSLPLLLLAACTGAAPAGDDTAANTNTDTGVASACSTVSSGTDWAWRGECPQMRTPCDIVVSACALTIDYDADGGMTMGMPYAGTIDGNTLTFADGDTVSGCVGVVEDADTISGTCDGGCTFTLER